MSTVNEKKPVESTPPPPTTLAPTRTQQLQSTLLQYEAGKIFIRREKRDQI